MKSIDLLKKRVNETRDKMFRAEAERDQLKKQEANYYKEATELVGEPVTCLADIARHRDEKKKATIDEMKRLAQELKAINGLTEQDIAQLEQEGYL